MSEKQAAQDSIYISNPIESTKVAAKRFIDTNLASFFLLLAFALVGFIAIVGLFMAAGVLNFTSNNTFQTGWLVFAGLMMMLVFGLIINIAVDYIYIQSQKLEAVSFRQAIKRGLNRAGVLLLSGVVGSLMVLGGLVLFIIPGIYIALRLVYVSSVVANEELGPIDSIKRSWDLTKGNLWDIIGAGLVVATIVAALTALLYGVLDIALNPDSFAAYFWVSDLLVGLASVPLAAVLYFRYHQSVLSKSGKIDKESTDSLNYLITLPAIIVLVASATYIDRLAPADSTFNQDGPVDIRIDTNSI